MTLTEERILIEARPQVEETAPSRSSRPPETTRDWSPMWLLVLVGAVAAVIVAFFALRPDSEADTSSHQQLIEQGSPGAVDHAAQVAVANHLQLVERGSPTAVDNAAGTGGTGSHEQLIEQGSPGAVDHAAQVAVANHQYMVELGSPTAVDNGVGSGGAGSHEQLVERGSPTAVDNAASS